MKKVILLVLVIIVVVSSLGSVTAQEPDKVLTKNSDGGEMYLQNIDPWSVRTPTFAWPYFSYEVSSAFRYRSPDTNCPEPPKVPIGFHRGIDVPRKQQIPDLKSAVNGLVVHVGPCSASSYGQVLTVNTWHGHSAPDLPIQSRGIEGIYVDEEDEEPLGLEYLLNGSGEKYVQVVYAHMVVGSFVVNVGQVVTTNQPVGHMGSTGAASGAHLHLEARLITHLWSSFVPNPSGSVFVNPISRNQGFFSSGTLQQVANKMNSCSIPGEDFFGDPVFYGMMPSKDCTNICIDSLEALGNTNYNVNCTIEGVAGILKGDYFIPVEYLTKLKAEELSRLGITIDDLSKARVDADSKELIMIDQLTSKLTEHLKGIE